jgi:hypothetical protein
MANPYHHALSSAKHWGGSPDQYRHIHEWFDATKGWLPDFRHRAIRHHSEGIAQAVELFDDIVLDSGRVIPVRWVAEQHVREDIGTIPTAADWLRCIEPQDWMVRGARPLSAELGRAA